MSAKPFMDMREWMLLQVDGVTAIPKAILRYSTNADRVLDLVERYDIAMESYYRWGKEGPPVGSIVKAMCLHVGNGRMNGRLRFCGISEQNPSMFMVRDLGDDGDVRLIWRSVWWNYIQAET